MASRITRNIKTPCLNLQTNCGWSRKAAFVMLAFSFPMTVCISEAQELDPDTGLKMAAGWEVVRATCVRCHSAGLITQNSGNREVWKSRIVWMQETQGLEQLPNETEVQILAYLAENYAQKAGTRRMPILQELLPPNPYGS
jgi:hypothetical protein